MIDENLVEDIKLSKYDFDIDTSEETSLGMIINNIEPNSVVLEFGCATGRMTRYLKENKNCKVYIVEYEQEAYDKAILHAEDGVCGDLLDLEWLEKFKDVRFDYITFADVLEHLKDPKTAIKKASELLSAKGQMFITIPNITHNDIIIKAIEDRFDYTSVGLLDDTHIHFWGFNNLMSMAQDTDLYVQYISATYCDMGNTEQYKGVQPAIDEYVLEYLNERQYGSVYQFFICMSKERIDEPQIRIKERQMYSKIYIDRGNGISEDAVIKVSSKCLANSVYKIHYEIENKNGAVKEFRFDPIEGQGCCIEEISVRSDNQKLPFEYSDNVVVGSTTILMGKDPHCIVDCSAAGEKITLDAIFSLAKIDFYNRALKEKDVIAEVLKKDNEELSAAVQSYKRLINDKDGKIACSYHEIEMLNNRLQIFERNRLCQMAVRVARLKNKIIKKLKR